MVSSRASQFTKTTFKLALVMFNPASKARFDAYDDWTQAVFTQRTKAELAQRNLKRQLDAVIDETADSLAQLRRVEFPRLEDDEADLALTSIAAVLQAKYELFDKHSIVQRAISP